VSHEKNEEETAVKGHAPDFTLTDINGKEVKLSDHKGKIVVLEWFNYDCPFVKYHYAEDKNTTSKLAEKYADKNVVWLTINSTHYATAQSNKEWADKHKVPNLLLLDSKGTVGKKYKAKTTPHLYVIDKNGKIAYQGALDNAPLGKTPEGEEYVNYADKAIAELLADGTVEITKTKPYGCSVKYPKE
jgi:peroxiredoxin